MFRTSSFTPSVAAPRAAATAWHRYFWLALVAATPLPLVAQYVVGSGEGFTFSPPVVTITVRGGVDQPMARSDIFAFTTSTLTLDRKSFASGSGSVDVAFRLRPRLDVVLGAGISEKTQGSEFRKFVDNNDRPIEQTTALRRTPLTVGVRYALTPTGERIGRFAWIPSRFTPWVGLGGGAMNYRFRQKGDFVNFETLAVFGDTFQSSGTAPMAYGTIGAEITLSTRLALSTDLRYSAARAKLNESFEGFDRIDLSGASATMGLSIRY